MATRSFRWLLVLACASVIALVSATVFLATTADEDGGPLAIGFELDADDEADDRPTIDDELDDGFDDEGSDDPFDYGDDPFLDELYDACADGDMLACDDLYYESPASSAYEEFGGTCGGFEPLYGECDLELGDDGAEELEEDLEGLREACADGDMEACDELYFDSPIGSDEEEFGSTCGGREEPTNGDCA